MNKADLMHLRRLADAAAPLPKGTRSTAESKFYAKARELVPGMVETLLLQERAIANLNTRVAELAARIEDPEALAGPQPSAPTKVP